MVTIADGIEADLIIIKSCENVRKDLHGKLARLIRWTPSNQYLVAYKDEILVLREGEFLVI
jgi:predicted TIM-barrel enzyme